MIAISEETRVLIQRSLSSDWGYCVFLHMVYKQLDEEGEVQLGYNLVRFVQ